MIEDGITSISQYSFYDCENLTEVSIPSSVKAIGYEAFHWCPNVGKVMIDGLESWCDIDFLIMKIQIHCNLSRPVHKWCKKKHRLKFPKESP